MTKLWAGMIGLGLVVAGASSSLLAQETTQEKAGKALQDIKASVFDALDKNSVEVSFEKGSAVLTDKAKSDIKALLDSVKKDGSIETVSVAVWSDSDAPVKDGEDLPKEQQDLASKRIDALQEYFKSQNQANVKTYNMAERVGLFADLFETDEAVAKKAMTDPTMRAEDEDDRVVEAMARVFKDKGGPSEAVVVAIRDKAELSH